MALEKRTGWIDAPLASVFQYVTDVTKHSEWSGSVEHGLQEIEVLTPGAIKSGSRWRSVGRNFTENLNRDESTVTEFDANRRFGFVTRFELRGAKVAFHHRYDFAPEREGTRLTYSLESAMPRNVKGLLFILKMATARRSTGKEVLNSGFAALAAALKRSTESEPHPTQP
jgi:uncharacterized protein YndB with AHSA1/START domain